MGQISSYIDIEETTLPFIIWGTIVPIDRFPFKMVVPFL